MNDFPRYLFGTSHNLISTAMRVLRHTLQHDDDDDFATWRDTSFTHNFEGYASEGFRVEVRVGGGEVGRGGWMLPFLFSSSPSVQVTFFVAHGRSRPLV